MDHVMRGLMAEQVDARKVSLGEVRIGYCMGCRTCESTGACVQNDDMKMIIEEISKSDIIAMGSPSYWGYVTGQTKVFFDRSLALCDRKTGQPRTSAGKVGISLAVSAGPQESGNKALIDAMECYFRNLHIHPLDRLSVAGVISPGDMQKKTASLDAACELGRMAARHAKDRKRAK
jgi:multimeric flavodoxin WrbA